MDVRQVRGGFQQLGEWTESAGALPPPTRQTKRTQYQTERPDSTRRNSWETEVACQESASGSLDLILAKFSPEHPLRLSLFSAKRRGRTPRKTCPHVKTTPRAISRPRTMDLMANRRAATPLFALRSSGNYVIIMEDETKRNPIRRRSKDPFHQAPV